jgi:Cu-Zn family superoxide dismutase
MRAYLPVALAAAAVALFAASPVLAVPDHVHAHGPLSGAAGMPRAASATVAATYDSAGDTTVVLNVRGLAPDTEYGAHVHLRGCGARPADAGPRFQLVRDPEQPSTDPAFANPDNEIWLDVTTGPDGAGRSEAVVPWQFVPGHEPGSVVIHAEHTAAGLHRSGTAGARLACLPVGF